MYLLNDHNCEKVLVHIKKINYDNVVARNINASNPSALLQNKAASLSVEGLRLLLLMSPIIGYFKADLFYLCAGLSTFNIAIQVLEGSNENIPVIAFTKKPPTKYRKQLAQLDISHPLVNKFHTNTSKYIGLLLRSWFVKEADKKSLHGSSEWQYLYPELKTKEKFASHLRISKRNL